ncbi:uncharacterized protein PADG_07040 [Paracoccidioides brasiliensis Pb18]|uniref:Uncharacterized protein n=1 Tax=Paracoccidioides brasiliensis (strain Pb18) TaxID=502780 RepID=C1GIF4_PARBD|nr:uncharacterized protein PADG_07040 [Paracoccidioides brasiliensis Pb18]EEH42220.2 hypothetical protein PADG_07040 [Paracoccidioides brasiliensis Pb18]
MYYFCRVLIRQVSVYNAYSSIIDGVPNSLRRVGMLYDAAYQMDSRRVCRP